MKLIKERVAAIVKESIETLKLPKYSTAKSPDKDVAKWLMMLGETALTLYAELEKAETELAEIMDEDTKLDRYALKHYIAENKRLEAKLSLAIEELAELAELREEVARYIKIIDSIHEGAKQ